MGKVVVYLLSTLYGTLPNIYMYSDILLNKMYLSSLVADAIIILWQLRALISLSNLLLLKIPYVIGVFIKCKQRIYVPFKLLSIEALTMRVFSCAVLPKFRYWTWNLHETYFETKSKWQPCVPMYKNQSFSNLKSISRVRDQLTG